jgi:Short C-terminal domain
MPGLLRGVARTAVVAGTATAVSNRVSRRQARRWGAQDAYAQDPYYSAPPEPAPMAAPPEEDPVARLRELAQLRDDGILTDEEFEAEKHKVLNG